MIEVSMYGKRLDFPRFAYGGNAQTDKPKTLGLTTPS
jgi:hypothetical protein